jgi:hypothetical protein
MTRAESPAPAPLPSPDGAPLLPEQIDRQRRIDTAYASQVQNGQMLGLTAGLPPSPATRRMESNLMVRATTSWKQGAYEGITGMGLLDATNRVMTQIGSFSDFLLLPDQRTHLIQKLQALSRMASVNPDRIDPASILHHVASLQQEMQQNPALRDEVRQAVYPLLAAYIQAVGSAPPALLISEPTNWVKVNPQGARDLDQQSKTILRLGAFIGAGALLALFGGVAAISSHDREGNIMKSLGAGGVMLLIAGGLPGGVGNQVAFLHGQPFNSIAGNRDYHMRDPLYSEDWARFTDTFWAADRGKMRQLVHKQGPYTDAEQAELIAALAPGSSITPFLLQMMTTNQGQPFRVFVSYLENATSPAARAYVRQYIGAGASRDALARAVPGMNAPPGPPGTVPGAPPGVPGFGPPPPGMPMPS